MSDWITSEILLLELFSQSPQPRTCQVKGNKKVTIFTFSFFCFRLCGWPALNSSGGGGPLPIPHTPPCSGGGGRYSCDECGKLFKHPGSLQHHRHIHRGTHKCPSCGKVTQGSFGPSKSNRNIPGFLKEVGYGTTLKQIQIWVPSQQILKHWAASEWDGRAPHWFWNGPWTCLPRQHTARGKLGHPHTKQH